MFPVGDVNIEPQQYVHSRRNQQSPTQSPSLLRVQLCVLQALGLLRVQLRVLQALHCLLRVQLRFLQAPRVLRVQLRILQALRVLRVQSASSSRSASSASIVDSPNMTSVCW